MHTTVIHFPFTMKTVTIKVIYIMWDGLFQQTIGLAGTFNPLIILIIFTINLIAEFGFSIPYLLETIWLPVGFQAASGALSPVVVLFLCLVSITGREIGAGLFYRVSSYGSSPFARLLQRLRTALAESAGKPLKGWKKYPGLMAIKFINHLLPEKSQIIKQTGFQRLTGFVIPFCIALGRFLWLKIPLTLTLGLTRQLYKLLLGVAIFSLMWDALYITLGIFGETRGISPLIMIPVTFSGILMLNLLIFGIRKLAFSASKS